MKQMKNRRGSALLIVLGMLAFMVVSAVGFAVYMRQSRVPSSHLRREATARYLLKSALANAISRVNGEYDGSRNRVEGIGDDPYPGLIAGTYDRGSYDSYNGNCWVKRVFSPFGMVDPSSTVSTLTLEALAYLPPAIINEVRVHSRRTSTATWRNLAYDLGRYAFCAVDVSDCFDINKLSKSSRRTSMAGQRISLSSLFPDDAEELSRQLASKAGSVPFVSLADFNIAFGKSDYTPFIRYFSGGNNGKMYLQNDADSVSNALFITDTWFPATNAYLTSDLELKTPTLDSNHFFDLSQEKNQPFKKSDFGLANFLEINTIGGNLAKQLMSNLSIVGQTCLYDYLDEDHIPMSLALPTTEAVPMVCGISLTGNYNLKFEAEDYADNSYTWTATTQEMDYTGQKKSVEHQIERKTRVVNFKGLDGEGLRVTGTVMYPFKRMKSDKRTGGSFTVEALVAAFVGSSDLRCRLTNEDFRPTQEDWANGGVRDGIVFYKTRTQTNPTFTDDIEHTRDALKEFICTVDLSTAASMPVFYHVTETEVTKGANPLPKEQLDEDVITLDGTRLEGGNPSFTLFDNRGEMANEFRQLRDASANSQSKGRLTAQGDREANPTGTKQQGAGTLSGKYNPYVVVWVRVREGNHTVDLAPAVFADDDIQLNTDYPEGAESKFAMFDGGEVPILDYRGDAEFAFDEEVLVKEDGPFNKNIVPQGWRSFFAVDPRYNFAPEDWFATNAENAKPETWLREMGLDTNGSGGNVFGSDGRDRDIFMFVSDQEHLQSIGELQFIPYVQRLGQRVTALNGDYQGKDRYHNGNNFDSRGPSNLGNFANGTRFWRTYSGYLRNNGNMDMDDPYYDLYASDGKPMEVVNGTDDFRVNPYSSDSRAIAAAVFDTPWDYYVASTNKQTNKALSSAEGSPEQYAFGEYAKITSDKWPEKTVDALASRMSAAIRTEAERKGGSLDWGLAYEDLAWDSGETGDNQTHIFDTLELGNNHPLHTVDRKFLFSYWRECFQNRQQLFLIFIRAEPLTVGGAGGDSLASSQLGARGVALVWRDPMPPPSTGTRKTRNELLTRDSWRANSEQNAPHRTRVLFYHQFD